MNMIPVNPWKRPVVDFVDQGVSLVDGAPIAITMISCVQRKEARQLSCPQFNHLDLSPEVFLSPCNPAGHCGNAEVTHRAVEFARGQGLPMLFLEDDVDVGDDFLAFLGEAVRQDVLTYFYTHDQEDLVRGRFPESLATKVLTPSESIPYGLYKRRRPRGGIVEGSQAVYIPKGLVAALRTQYAMWIGKYRHEFGCWPCDVMIINSAMQSGFWPYIAMPNPIQHRHDRTARGGVESTTFKKSLTFGRIKTED